MSFGHRLTSSFLKNVLPLQSYWRGTCAIRGTFNRSWCIAQSLSRPMSTMDDPIQLATLALRKKENQLKKLTPAEAWAQRSARLDLPAPADPYAGRRILVTSDLRSTFVKLSRRLHRNSVYKEWKLSSRHEKRGIKRSRLRSERWRKRFADEVRRKVQLVSTIRRRG
ncbi:hypothetical protein V8B97DRAFT_1949945 [Scleroderma yunnanense]